ncbi:hypothetical protein EDC96DRAFT_548236 [Choanephora cucurbitarum]|nr:hypothetical protein EDC96DRAFT_548236 [Choanephora cucurbitarum]
MKDILRIHLLFAPYNLQFLEIELAFSICALSSLKPIFKSIFVSKSSRYTFVTTFASLKHLLAVCNEWKHAFGYYMIITSGVETIRVYNILDNNSPAQHMQAD